MGAEVGALSWGALSLCVVPGWPGRGEGGGQRESPALGCVHTAQSGHKTRIWSFCSFFPPKGLKGKPNSWGLLHTAGLSLLLSVNLQIFNEPQPRASDGVGLRRLKRKENRQPPDLENGEVILDLSMQRFLAQEGR